MTSLLHLFQTGHRRWLVLVSLVLASIVPLAGYFALRLHAPQVERDAFASLEAIAQLKSTQIENWFDERYNDGAVIMATTSLIKQIEDLQITGKKSVQESLRENLIAVIDAVQYESATLISPDGRLLMTIGEQAHDPGETTLALVDAFNIGRPAHAGVFFDKNGHQHIDLVVPLYLFENRTRRAVGALILHVLAEDSLLAALNFWPTASQSGEIILIRRDGNSISYLNRLRHSPSLLNRPVGGEDMVASTALVKARSGVKQGNDYRGTPVFAAFRPVTGTNWVVGAKLDRDEVLEPLRDLALWVSLIALLAILVVSAVMYLFWRQRAQNERLALQAQSDRLLQQFFDLPFIGIAISSYVTKHWLKCNDHLCRILGYTREDMDKISWQQMTHPGDLAADNAEFERMMRGECDGYALDKRFIRKDGNIVYTSLEVRCVRKADNVPEFIFATVQDISERKQAEAKIERLTGIYAALSETNQTIARSSNQGLLFSQICRIAVQLGGMKMAWVGVVSPETLQVVPAASFGDGTELLDELQLSADAGSLSGRGATGGAIRENSAFWIQDFKNDPMTSNWRALGERAGWGASAVLPLSCSGNVVGVLMLYAAEANAFDETARNLLTEMAADISFALDSFAAETERQAMDEQLRLAAIVFAQSAEAIMVTDAEHRILMVNRAYSEITGYSPDEVIGRNPRLMASGCHDENYYRSMWEAIHSSGHWQGEMWNRRKNGEIYPEMVSISRVIDADGKLSHYVGIFTDISEHRANEAHIHRLAYYDSLTGLPNRALLAERAGQELSRVERNGETLAMIFLDLDRFKNVNDSLGHRIGDVLLVQVAERLRRSLRDEDTVARLGGDEFILLLPGISADGAAHVAEKMLQTLSSPYLIEQHELTITPSLGIAMYPVDGRGYEELSMCADTAMYRAKQGGRQTYRFFTREMQDRTDRTLQIENALRRAIGLEQLYLVYQPQLTASSDQVVGVEALIRWQHPILGLVSPAEFIPVAEDSGLILPVGEWVLRKAVSQMALWLKEGLPLHVMAVNLSAIQFRQANLPELVSQILEEYDLPPHCLELELTEGVAMDNPLAAIEVMGDLHARGVRMSIDDFGTGYSSLSYLKRFKVYKLKIDQSFVRDIACDPEDEAIVEAIIGLSRSLGLRTIAEGVETQQQLDFLREKGCDEVQGYLFARPMLADELVVFVRSRPLSG